MGRLALFGGWRGVNSFCLILKQHKQRRFKLRQQNTTSKLMSVSREKQTMGNPPLSVSNSLHFPAIFLEKLETLLCSHSHLWFKSNRTLPSVLFLTQKNSSSLGLTNCAFKKNQECIVDFKDRKGWIHFVGIGGCGLSALAMLAIKQDFEVSGSDMVWSSYMDGLQEAGARLTVGHSESNMQRNNGSRFPNAIVVSSAIPQDNVEILLAKSVGVPVYKRDYWLAKLTENYNLIAVSGSHGKSTTASMLSYVLKAMGDDLTAVVGAHVPQFPDGSVMLGGGKNFVLEADEYDGCFLGLSPYVAIVTNLDWEHADIFQDEKYFQEIPQANQGGWTSRYMWGQFHKGYPLAEISLRIPGVHNVVNSLAVIATVLTLIGHQRQFYESIDCIKLHLSKFSGISRRFELIGTIHRCHIYDDYAHHPTEVRAVLQAARQRFPNKTLVVVFQPHTYSRLVALKDDFATAFSDADQVVVTAVYAARETNKWNVNGMDLAASIIGPRSEYIPSLDDVVDKLVLQISKDLHHEIAILTLGAGDVTTVGPKLLHELQNTLQYYHVQTREDAST